MNGNGFFGPGSPFMSFLQNADVDKEMQLRMSIMPHLKDIQEGRIPNTPFFSNVANLNWFVNDCKSEGNDFFRDKNYPAAYQLYTVALNLYHYLVTSHEQPIDSDLLSALFCNRAFCLLKMDCFKDSVLDCDLALSENPDNYKAFYRKALALKALRKYSLALKAALGGKECVVRLRKPKEAKEFDELILEIKCHLPAESEPGAVAKTIKFSSPSPTVASKPDPTPKPDSTPKKPSNVAEVKPPNPSSAKKTTNSKSGTAAAGKTSQEASITAKSESGAAGKTSQEKSIPKTATSKAKKGKVENKPQNAKQQNGVTETNSPVTSKDSEVKVQEICRQSKKSDSDAAKASYAGRFSFLQRDDDGGGNDDEADDDNDSNSNHIKPNTLVKDSHGVGLDDFYIPGEKKLMNLKPSDLVTTSLQSCSTNPPVINKNPKVSLLPATKTTSSQVSNQVQKSLSSSVAQAGETLSPLRSALLPTPPALMPMPSSLLPTKINMQPSGPKDLLAGKLEPLQSRIPLEYPFDTKYDFNLVCERCYVQKHAGHSGYVARVLLPHNCKHNYLVVRVKNDPDARWALVRPRNIQIHFLGKFRICNDFLADSQCKQEPCTFAHYDAEADLWTMDREGVFAVRNFVIEQSRNFAAGLLWCSEVIPSKPAQLVVSETRSLSQMSKSAMLSTANAVSASKENMTSFPLPARHGLFCDICLVSPDGQLWSYINEVPPNHVCSETMLAVKNPHDMQWTKIREIKNHRPFRGGFAMCRQIEAKLLCMFNEDCSYAHSISEQLLWTMEKNGEFSIVQFIRENRKKNNVGQAVNDLQVLLSKHQGELGYLCSHCFQVYQLLVTQSRMNPLYCNRGVHVWHESRIMIHYSINGEITLIGKRVYTAKNAVYRLCRHQQYCNYRWMGTCTFAHSVIERDIWDAERDLNVTQDQLLAEANRINQLAEVSRQAKGAANCNSQTPAAAMSVPSQPTAVTGSPGGRSSVTVPAVKSADSTGSKNSAAVPNVVAVCSLCLQNGNICRQGVGKKSEMCTSPVASHSWPTNKVYVLLPSRKRVKKLPNRIPMNCNFAICKHLLLKRDCSSWLNTECQFAHSDEEIELWKWMVANGVKTLEEVAEMSVKQNLPVPAVANSTPAAPWKAITHGQSVVEVKQSGSRLASLFSLAVNSHYCQFCCVHCNGQKQWDEHCASEKHTFNVSSDQEHQWNYRQPPWGVSASDFKLCALHETGGRCKFSDVPDTSNQCKFAHSQGELDEWHERLEWRKMKRDMDKSQHIYSYMKQLLEEYEKTSSGNSIITEELDGVKVECSTNIHIFEENKELIHSWVFFIRMEGDKVLQKVALLRDRDRLHFSLRGSNLDRDCQIAPGEDFEHRVERKSFVYKVEVAFVGGLFGSFSQWVIFDFGDRPVLVRKLSVDLGTKALQIEVKTLREQLKFDRWTSDNRSVIWMDSNEQAIESSLNSDLIMSYKAPCSADVVITQETVGSKLNGHNYVHKMHAFLHMEELTQAQIIARYNLKVEVTLLRTIIEERSGMVNAREGELFARVPLTDQLNDDTDAGHLILSGVTRVLLALQHRSNQTVYEAVLVQMDNFNFNGRGKDYVYICLSARCCKDLGLQPNTDVEVEIQFQMNRLPFCLMHYAVDQLVNTDFVFPDLSKVSHSWDEKSALGLQSSSLNEDQMKVIEFIAAERPGFTPPLIVYGPFGTGKTETLAQAAMFLTVQNIGARILICTRSNSAADVYILRHFDELRKKNMNVKVLRVIATDRRMNTIPATVRQYCLLSANRTQFRTPTKEDILHCDIVITTLVTSLVLTKLDVQGCFTHIFIDEAAQVLECEAIMPLCLASESTRVVLAGDCNQMSQKVYSGEARRQQFNHSLVERLFHHYGTYASLVGKNLPSILLSSNYRTKMELVRFLAAVFYGGPDALHSVSKLPDVYGIVPLTFYTAQGRELQDQESTSYYNLAEVEEIVERVSTLVGCWPDEWTQDNVSAAESILVVTPYLDQVIKIRSALRKKGRELQQDLSRVSVERVSNVQGTEYHVVFLSTVRTRHLVEERPRMLYSGARECDGEIGDYGFLSDIKLLNTALSRARFMVAVVGDPVSLCAPVSKCATVWRTFLKHCEKLGSLVPSCITLDIIRGQVVDLMSSQATNVEMINKFHKDSSLGNYQVDQNGDNAEVVENDHEFASIESCSNPFEAVTLKGVFEDWNLDYQIEPDKIMEQLAKAASKNVLKEVEKAKAGLSNSNLNPAESESPIKVTCVRLHNGHAVLDDFNVTHEPRKVNVSSRVSRRQLVGDGVLDEYNSDSDDSSDVDANCNEPETFYVDISTQQLHDMLLRQPERYKRATLVVENSSKMYAKCIGDASVEKVKLGSRRRCGRAFNNDEVVVEILPVDPEDVLAVREDERDVVHGQVIGILRRSINPKFRMFVCMIDPSSTGLMVPVNRSIPKMYNLETRDHMMKSKKGHVCVYTFTRSREIVFHHYEPVDMNNPAAKLFIVRYLKWDANCFFPLGIVIGVMPMGSTIDSALNILRIEHYVPEKFKEDTIKEIQSLYPDRYEIPRSTINSRFDCCGNTTFTVDPEDSTDLDDAISIEVLRNSSYVIGFHIADVSYFVRQGSFVDQEAQSRGSSLYPVGQPPVPMLPARLSSDLCSLLPGKERLTVSVFITIDSKADIQRVAVKRCVINSDYRLTYNIVEQVLKGNSDVLCSDSRQLPEELNMHLLMLSRTANIWRSRRLGTSSLHCDSSDDAPMAHLVIEELMLTVNHQVALLLTERQPRGTPLRTQLPPDEIPLQKWRDRFRSDARNTVLLTRAFKRCGEVCSCTSACTCISDDMATESIMDIKKSVWNKMVSAAVADNLDKVQSLILDPNNHPQLAVAARDLQLIQHRSTYICSGELSDTVAYHNSLNVSCYTSFTSPIRRYMDIVVGRMVVDCLINSSGVSPYNQSDISDVCYRSNETLYNARKYESATRAVYCAHNFRQQPISILSVVSNLTESGFDVCIMANGSSFPSSFRISYASLDLSDAPTATQDGSMVLKWRQRLYDLEWWCRDQPAIEVEEIVMLNSDKFIYQTPSNVWRSLVQSVISDRDEIIASIVNVKENLVDPADNDQFVTDVTSEGRLVFSGKQFVNFAIELRNASVIEVQFNSDFVKGLPSPHLQLLKLTPTFDICLEHRNKIACFASTYVRSAIRQSYVDVSHYQSSWLPVMALEAANQAVGNNFGTAVIIRHVPIIWQSHGDPSEVVFYGTCEIPFQFVKDRCIVLNGSSDEDFETDENSSTVDSRVYGYMCVRYDTHASEIPESLKSTKALKCIEEDGLSSTSTWVGHCIVTGIKLDHQLKMFKMKLRLNQSSSCLPQQLLFDGPQVATVEWIPKALSDRRAEEAVSNLEKATQLAKDIALGKNTHADFDKSYLEISSKVSSKEMPGLPPLNSKQHEAITKALKQPFTVIQGPPGTGKTALVARLACLFTIVNDAVAVSSSSTSRRQVMVCGPSNKSVDVVTRYLKQLKSNCPRIVRVFGDYIEQAAYPQPSDFARPARGYESCTSADDIRDVSLHHMVRSCTVNEERGRLISEIDSRVKTHETMFAPEEIIRYKDAVEQTESDILRQADIVLCTCSTSVINKIQQNTSIYQVIIDECGMCTEPESLIPIVSTRASQVVLVGDHMQLQPIVTESIARRRGMMRSLFERYSSKAVMLTVQYRMHDAIAAFPSAQFYNGQLTIGKEEQSMNSMMKFWPNGRNKPIAFVHIVGCEQSVSISTSDGGEQSKFNLSEVDLVVRTVSSLRCRFHVKPTEVAVLSQYREQCSLIEKELQKKQEKDVTVSTIVSAQGSEWDYVVLSTVRSMPKCQIEKEPTIGWRYRHLGFITDTHQINVALTRARKGIIIIGNQHVLHCDSMWRKLLSHYANDKKVVDASQFMKS